MAAAAFFYPNLGSVTAVEIAPDFFIEGIRVNASHDAGAAAAETRCFIDADLWNRLRKGWGIFSIKLL